MSKKKHGVKYNLAIAIKTERRNSLNPRVVRLVPFATGPIRISARDFVAKATSEKYRRIKT